MRPIKILLKSCTGIQIKKQARQTAASLIRTTAHHILICFVYFLLDSIINLEIKLPKYKHLIGIYIAFGGFSLKINRSCYCKGYKLNTLGCTHSATTEIFANMKIEMSAVTLDKQSATPKKHSVLSSRIFCQLVKWLRKASFC